MTAKSNNTKTAWVDLDDAPELTAEDFDRAEYRIGDKPVSRTEYTAAVRKRGRPVGSVKADAKLQVTLRIPPDVLARWKATGPGWQTRMVERLSGR